MSDEFVKSQNEPSQKNFVAMSSEIDQITIALALAHSQMPSASKDSTAGGAGQFVYKYADITSVIKATMKPLSDNGLAIIQLPIPDPNGVRIRTLLTHKSGQWFAGESFVPNYFVEKINPRNFMQGIGSVTTYLRRYGWISACGLASEDNDGVTEEQLAQWNQKQDYPQPVKRQSYQQPIGRITAQQKQDLEVLVGEVYQGDLTMFYQQASSLLRFKFNSIEYLNKQQADILILKLKDAIDSARCREVVNA